jgi:hypothetical protein
MFVVEAWSGNRNDIQWFMAANPVNNAKDYHIGELLTKPGKGRAGRLNLLARSERR